MVLIIAEKPSLARNIAAGLGDFRRRGGYLEGENCLISWAFGHLFSLADIEHYNPRPEGERGWTMKNLPCFPKEFSYELRRRIIEPYRERRFFWEKHDNNWTAVCMGGVGSVLLYESPEVYYENRDRIHASMECYLASYKDDGMCVEGIGYWGFGFGFFSAFAL